MRVEAKYPIIEKALRKSILSGKFPTGLLPGVQQLAKEYRVTPMTANKAVNNLLKEGLIFRIPNHGTFVSNDLRKKIDSCKVVQCDRIFQFKGNSFMEIMETAGIRDKIIPTPFQSSNDEMDYIQFIGNKKNPHNLVPVHEGIISSLAERNLLLPLDNFLDSSSSLVKKKFHRKSLEAFSYKGTIYGLPSVFSPCVMFYNQNVFREKGIPLPPKGWKWTDFLNLAKKLTGRDESNDRQVYGVGFLPSNLNIFLSFVFQNNGEFFGPNGECRINSKEIIETIKFITDLYYHHKVAAPTVSATEDDIWHLFEEGFTAMSIGFFNHYLRLKNNSNIDFGVCCLPCNKRIATTLPVQGWAIPAYSEKKKTAFEMIEKLLLPKPLQETYLKTGRIPAYDTSEFNVPQTFINAAESGEVSWKHPSRNHCSLIKKELNLVFCGFSSADAACKKLQKAINK